jgi:hypothetical protein
MSGMTTGNSAHLIRSQVWSNQLKDVLYPDLTAQGLGLVDWITDFPDGNTINIPSVGQLQVRDYVEDQAVQYDPLDTGNFQFSINEYISSATYITNKNKQDGFYMDRLVSMFVPKQARAINEHVEIKILKEGQPRTGNPAGYQVAGNQNLINGAPHRWVGSNVVGGKQTMGIADLAKVVYSLKKANVPQTALIGIVDPSFEYLLNTMTNLTNASWDPKFEGIVTTGFGRENRFVRNVFGIDLYTSNFLPLCGTDQTGTSETINGTASGANAVCNIFFSAAPDLKPFVGAWRQMPNVDSEYNKDFQREEYVTTARYDTKIYRPENFITVLSDPSAV